MISFSSSRKIVIWFNFDQSHSFCGSGILIRNLADVSGGYRFLSLQQIIYNLVGFCIASASTICITVYAKRALQIIQAEDELV